MRGNLRVEHCSNLDDMLVGSWCRDASLGLIPTKYDMCPNTLQNLKFPYLSNKDKFANGSVEALHFVPKSKCMLMRLDHALEILLRETKVKGKMKMTMRGTKSARKSLVFIGDSLGSQLFYNAKCELEGMRSHLSNRLEFIYTPYLRPDLPCHKNCSDSTFFEHWKGKFPDFCLGCRPIDKDLLKTMNKSIESSNNSTSSLTDGKGINTRNKVSFRGVALVDDWHWCRFLNLNQTAAIVINSGAWFSPFFGFTVGSGPGSGDDYFENTLQMNAPIIRYLIETESISVAWLVLPPTDTRREEWDWHRFRHRNRIAKKILEPLGVIFIDFWNVALARYIHDTTATVDLLHWRGPAYLSFPHFLNRLIFHALALSTQRGPDVHGLI